MKTLQLLELDSDPIKILGQPQLKTQSNAQRKKVRLADHLVATKWQLITLREGSLSESFVRFRRRFAWRQRVVCCAGGGDGENFWRVGAAW
jgi:hypothetical protein